MITPPGARFSGLAALDVTALQRPTEHVKPALPGSSKLASGSRPPVELNRRRPG
jgi:hypothetical protein